VPARPRAAWALASADVISVGCRYDRAARLWDLDTGKCLGEFSGHRSIVTWAKLSPDDSRMVTASFDCTLKGTRSAAQIGIRAILHLVLTAVDVCVCVCSLAWPVWDTAAARCTATLVGHTDSVLDGDLIPGGRFVLSCSMDGTVRLWGVSTSACYRVYRSHAPGAWVKSVLFTPDGRGFVSAGLDHRYALLVHVPLCMPSRVCVCVVWCMVCGVVAQNGFVVLGC